MPILLFRQRKKGEVFSTTVPGGILIFPACARPVLTCKCWRFARESAKTHTVGLKNSLILGKKSINPAWTGQSGLRAREIFSAGSRRREQGLFWAWKEP